MLGAVHPGAEDLARGAELLVAVGDVDGDGKSDIVLQNDNGAVAVWDMNGAAISQAAVVADPGPAWSVSGDGAMPGICRSGTPRRLWIGTDSMRPRV